jgi:hypothetical protein
MPSKGGGYKARGGRHSKYIGYRRPPYSQVSAAPTQGSTTGRSKGHHRRGGRDGRSEYPQSITATQAAPQVHGGGRDSHRHRGTHHRRRTTAAPTATTTMLSDGGYRRRGHHGTHRHPRTIAAATQATTRIRADGYGTRGGYGHRTTTRTMTGLTTGAGGATGAEFCSKLPNEVSGATLPTVSEQFIFPSYIFEYVITETRCGETGLTKDSFRAADVLKLVDATCAATRTFIESIKGDLIQCGLSQISTGSTRFRIYIEIRVPLTPSQTEALRTLLTATFFNRARPRGSGPAALSPLAILPSPPMQK